MICPEEVNPLSIPETMLERHCKMPDAENPFSELDAVLERTDMMFEET